jgi:hypothetical protein
MKIYEIEASVFEKDSATGQHTKHVVVAITHSAASAAFVEFLSHLGCDIETAPDAGRIELSTVETQKTDATQGV